MFRSILMIGLVFGLTTSALALTDEECEQLLIEAENTPMESVYQNCGFDDVVKAWNTWAPFAAAHQMKHALLELCKRHPTHQYGMMYCQKSVDLNYGPALAYLGDINFKNGNIKEAISYYTRAIEADNLQMDVLSDIREKIGLLYLVEGGEYFNPRNGIALLTKAASQNRSAVSNNMLGYLVFSGKYGLKQDTEKALDFFWRGILLGCPAAEENMGALQLVKQGTIPADEASYYMSLQADTCQPVDPKKLPPAVKKPIGIRPYHITFTKAECQEIEYYAKRLMDTKLPYTGKKECVSPGLDETTKKLLGM